MPWVEKGLVGGSRWISLRTGAGSNVAMAGESPHAVNDGKEARSEKAHGGLARRPSVGVVRASFCGSKDTLDIAGSGPALGHRGYVFTEHPVSFQPEGAGLMDDPGACLDTSRFALVRAWLLDSWKFHEGYGGARLRIEVDGATCEAASSKFSSMGPAR